MRKDSIEFKEHLKRIGLKKGFDSRRVFNGVFKKGHKTNLGKKRQKFSKEHCKKISESMKGKPAWNRGKPMSEEQKRKISFTKRGGKELAKLSVMKIRKSLEYRLWREAVFRRDNYTCKFCGKKGGRINADHIKPFSLFPELRFSIDNGRTLCEECHRKTDTWFYKIKNYKKEIIK